MMKRRWSRVAFGATIIVLALLGIARATGIPLSSFLIDQGTFPVLGGDTVTIASDQNYTATSTDYAANSMNVTSSVALTADRLFFIPCNAGESKDITNNTDGGKNLLVACKLADGGPAGATATIASGTLAHVVTPDGVNYLSVSGGGGFDSGSPPPIGNVTPNAVYANPLVSSTWLQFASGVNQFFAAHAVVYSSDADKDLTGSPTVYNTQLLYVTGTVLTTTRKLILPLGGPWWIYNGTSTSPQTITVIGPTGTGTDLPAGKLGIFVSSDGVNMYGVVQGSGSGSGLTFVNTVTAAGPTSITANTFVPFDSSSNAQSFNPPNTTTAGSMFGLSDSSLNTTTRQWATQQPANEVTLNADSNGQLYVSPDDNLTHTTLKWSGTPGSGSVAPGRSVVFVLESMSGGTKVWRPYQW